MCAIRDATHYAAGGALEGVTFGSEVVVTAHAAAAGFSYREIVQELRTSGLKLVDIARATGVRERQVQNWAAGTSRPQNDTRDRLVDIHYVVRLLADIYKPEGVEIWLHARNPELGGARPLDLLAASNFPPVVQAVERLQSGAM